MSNIAVKKGHPRLQFRLATLCMLVGLCALSSRIWMSYREHTDLEGTWREIGRHKGLSASFHRHQLAIANKTGVRSSQFEVSQLEGRITIRREEGVQEGYYRVTGDQLEINLGTVGFPPPTGLSDKNRDAIRYLFERAR